MIPAVDGCPCNDPQRLGKGAGKLGNRRTSRDHLGHSILKIGQNTEKSRRNLRGIAVIQTPVKDHQLTQM